MKLILLISILVNLLIADTWTSGMKVEKNNEKILLDVITIYNEEPPKNGFKKTEFGEIAFIDKDYNFTVNKYTYGYGTKSVEKINVDINISFSNTFEQNMCGPQHVAHIKLSINDQLIIDTNFNDCMRMLNKAEIDFKNEKFLFCEEPYNDEYKGCVEFSFATFYNSEKLQNRLKGRGTILEPAMSSYYGRLR